MDIKDTLNRMLVKDFHEILELEKEALITEEFSDISYNDMHIIEAIGLDQDSKMGEVARRLHITVGALTTSMNALVHKGYVARSRSKSDRRVVNVYLLEKGIAAYRHHEDFHRRMTEDVLSILDEEQVKVLVSSLERLMEFFESYRKDKPEDRQAAD